MVRCHALPSRLYSKYDRSAFQDSNAFAVIDTLADYYEVASVAVKSKGKQLSPLAAGCLTANSPGLGGYSGSRSVQTSQSSSTEQNNLNK